MARTRATTNRMSNVPSQMAHSSAGDGSTPWHGSSNPIPKDATLKQIQKLAGADFKVAVDVARYGPNSEFADDGFRILYRTDNGRALSQVGRIYKPMQNDVAFGFVKEFVEAGDMVIETAGVFGGGKTFWLLADAGESFFVGGKRAKDEVKSKLLFYIPHKCGESIQINWTSVRVVCSNTLSAALGEAGVDRVRILHHREYSDEIEAAAKEKLGLAHETFSAFKKEAEILANTAMPLEMAKDITISIFGTKGAETDRNVARVLGLFQGEARGATLPSAKGTAWGLLNAATEYVDYQIGKRGDQTMRLERAFFGRGAFEKRRMREAVVEYATNL